LFRYSTTAGTSGENPSSATFVPGAVNRPFFSGVGAATGPFFVVFAMTDLDGDGAPYTTFAGTNLTNEVVSHNVGE
jgi:hypothetical protein